MVQACYSSHLPGVCDAGWKMEEARDILDRDSWKIMRNRIIAKFISGLDFWVFIFSFIFDLIENFIDSKIVGRLVKVNKQKPIKH